MFAFGGGAEAVAILASLPAWAAAGLVLGLQFFCGGIASRAGGTRLCEFAEVCVFNKAFLIVLKSLPSRVKC